jgi:signal transduction histidine kinase
LHRSLQAEPDVVQGDDYQLQQAFVNLLLNALEATGPDGTLTVMTEIAAGGGQSPAHLRSSRQIQITIADNGEGIAPEHLDRLFEPFFTTKAEGTGLGLPITRRIIEDHHGTVTVQSRPKKGTTFRIILPAHSPAAAAS